MGSPETSPPATPALAPDHDLLREYAERHAEDAFRALVERHGGMVHGVARRLAGNEHAAADITQSVFLALARKSSTLSRAVPLAGWLHTAARYAASHWLRGEARRRERERAARLEEVHAVNAESERAWEEVSPWLDAALAALSPRDREAVLLRFFEQRSFSDVAAGLGTTEDAAKMRVGRAVRKLRAFLQRRGAGVDATVLATCLAGHAAATAPANVVAAATQLAGSGAASGAGIAALANAISAAMRWARLKRILWTASAAAAVAVGVGIGFLSLRPSGDLTTTGAVESLLRESRVFSGTWQATPAGLAVDEMAWAHLALRGPFTGDYRLEIAYRQQNPAGAVEFFLPAGSQMMLIVLPPPSASGASRALDAVLASGPPQPVEHVAEIEVRRRGETIALAVKLDRVAALDTKDVPAALKRATMVPEQPRGVLGLGTMRTGAVFTRLDVQPLRSER